VVTTLKICAPARGGVKAKARATAERCSAGESSQIILSQRRNKKLSEVSLEIDRMINKIY